MPEQQTSEHLKRKILLFSALSISIISLILSITAMTPLYNRLKSEQRSDLEHQVQIKLMIVEEFLSRAKDTARQITSRTQIRKKLEAYNRKEINLDELLSFTGSKLADAMKLSDDVVGISRLDSSKKLVVQVGIPIPETFWKIPDDSSKAVLINGPVIIKGESYVILGAPISNRKAQRVGTDIVLFSIKGLQRIVGDYNNLGETGETILGKIENNEVLLFFPLRNSTEAAIKLTTNTSFVGSALVETAKQKNGIIDFTNPSGPNVVIAYGSIHNGMWGMMIKMDKKELYYSINREILFISLVILFLIALGTVGMVIVLRPLTGKILMHTSDLEAKIEEKTSELMNTSNKLKEANTNLNNVINEHIRTEEMMHSSQSVAHICSYSTNLNVNEIEKSSWVCSPEFYNIFGIDKTYPHTIEGWANFIHPDYREEVFDYHESVVKEKKLFSREYKIIRINDGAERWVHGTGKLEFDEKGNPFRMHGAIQDITERKQSEEEKKNLQTHLQQAQKMEAIGTLAGGIAHDFNNILSVILGYTELAQADAPSETKYLKDLDKVLEAADRAKNLVAQILAFSRQSEVDRMPIKMQPLIKEGLKMLRSSIPTTISITENIDPKSGVILADPTQIHQILMNLCTNAFHAMEATGGELSVSLKTTLVGEDDKEILLHVTPGEYVEFTVSDNGAGIEPDVIEKIFDLYFTTKKIGKGTGMGLAIIHGIMKEYGGAIIVESQLGKGTTFHVYFPVIQKGAIPEIKESEDLPKGKERILFIDDEEFLAELGKDMLERLGYHVTVRRSSMEALTTFQNTPNEFDLVITDQTIPDMTGSDLARRMIQIRPDIPIILCTGYSNLVDEDSAKALGIKEFALKPLSKRVMSKLIRKVLDAD